MAANKVCTNCGYIGHSKRVTKGSVIIELVLWLFMILPGLIYSVWRLTTRSDACPQCGAPNMIPAGSPIAQKFLHDNPNLTPQAFRGSTTEGSGIAAFLLITLLVVGVGGYLMHSNRQSTSDSSSKQVASTPSISIAASPNPAATTRAAIPPVTDYAPAGAPPTRSATPANLKRFSTVAEAQQEALRLYPALGVAGSPFNREFIALHKKYQQEHPDYLRDNSWPVTLAREVAATIKSQ